MKRKLLNFFFTITGFYVITSLLSAFAGKSFRGFLSLSSMEKSSDISSSMQSWKDTAQTMNFGYSVPLSPI